MNKMNNDRMNNMMNTYYTLNSTGNLAAAMLLRSEVSKPSRKKIR